MESDCASTGCFISGTSYRWTEIAWFVLNVIAFSRMAITVDSYD